MLKFKQAISLLKSWQLVSALAMFCLISTQAATITQQAYLKASNTDAGDQFGVPSAISGDIAVMGAPFESSGAIGINGNQTNNNASQSGAAYVFVRAGTNWAQQAYLKPSNADSSDQFGTSVAASGSTIVVGAVHESSNSTGINGDQNNNNATPSGAAYVFVRDGTNWTQQAYIKASNTGVSDGFGTSVAVSGDTVVVGAPQEDSDATGVNGNEADESTSGAGAVYVFARNGTNWIQQAYLKASNTGTGDQFGFSVAVSGDIIVVGAPGESSAATGVDGNQNDDSTFGVGAAYVFVRTGTNWGQEAYLKPSVAERNEGFGYSVAISGGTVVIGSPQEPDSGSVYAFVRNGTNWSQQARLKAPNTDTGDKFGLSVSVSANALVVGAPWESSDAVGVNGDGNNNNDLFSGAAYVFVRTETNWSHQAYLKASNTESGDSFGQAVAISGDTVIAGANREASNATGVNGNQNDNNAYPAGAAYVFTGLGPSPRVESLALSGNTLTFQFSGIPGFTYEIQQSTNVVGVWITLGQSTAGLDGILGYTNEPVTHPTAFFRLLQH